MWHGALQRRAGVFRRCVTLGHASSRTGAHFGAHQSFASAVVPVSSALSAELPCRAEAMPAVQFQKWLLQHAVKGISGVLALPNIQPTLELCAQWQVIGATEGAPASNTSSPFINGEHHAVCYRHRRCSASHLHWAASASYYMRRNANTRAAGAVLTSLFKLQETCSSF
jgi:hypothetical protein